MPGPGNSPNIEVFLCVRICRVGWSHLPVTPQIFFARVGIWKGSGEWRGERDWFRDGTFGISFSCTGYLPNVNAEKEPVCAKLMMLFLHLIAPCQRKSTRNRFLGWQSKSPHRVDSAIILSKVHRASLLSLGHSDKFLKTGTPDSKERTSKTS